MPRSNAGLAYAVSHDKNTGKHMRQTSQHFFRENVMEHTEVLLIRRKHTYTRKPQTRRWVYAKTSHNHSITRPQTRTPLLQGFVFKFPTSKLIVNNRSFACFARVHCATVSLGFCEKFQSSSVTLLPGVLTITGWNCTDVSVPHAKHVACGPCVFGIAHVFTPLIIPGK